MRRKLPSTEELVEGIRSKNRVLLARAITMAESHAPQHRAIAQEVLKQVMVLTGKSIRIGITGTPGAGKSTFIEAFGLMLCELGHRVAVLAVDPSSSITGGSILGDKTRMEALSCNANAFIRPSPSGRSLGGVAAKTREAMLLCEAAGFDVILIETVGVGQSETAVRTMTDFFLLLQIAGGGDELQGIKKGVIELADAIVVNKADGNNQPNAERARAEYKRVLQILHPFTPDWKPRALTCSALKNTGIDEVWKMINEFRDEMERTGTLDQRRCEQMVDWFTTLLHERIMEDFNSRHSTQLAKLKQQVAAGDIPVSSAVDILLN